MIEIQAKKGYYLTQVGEVGNDRMFVTAIKGARLNPNDWREATEEEKNEFEAQQEAERKKAEEKNEVFNPSSLSV